VGKGEWTLAGDKNYDTQELVRELRGDEYPPRMWRRTIRTAGARWISGLRGHAGYEVRSAEAKNEWNNRSAWMKMVGMLKESEVARDREGRVAVHLHRKPLTTSADCENLMARA